MDAMPHYCLLLYNNGIVMQLTMSLQYGEIVFLPGVWGRFCGYLPHSSGHIARGQVVVAVRAT